MRVESEDDEISIVDRIEMLQEKYSISQDDICTYLIMVGGNLKKLHSILYLVDDDDDDEDQVREDLRKKFRSRAKEDRENIYPDISKMFQREIWNPLEDLFLKNPNSRGFRMLQEIKGIESIRNRIAFFQLDDSSYF